MIKYIVAFLFACLSLSPAAEDALGGYPTRCMQHVEEEGVQYLRTPMATYIDAAGRELALIGAVHVADAAYYEELNSIFEGYDKLLYEMVDGAGLVEERQLAKKVEAGEASEEEQAQHQANLKAQKKARKKLLNRFIKSQYESLANELSLSLQSEFIDYSCDNFVYADVSSEELKRMMRARGESWAGLLVGNFSSSMGSWGEMMLASLKSQYLFDGGRAMRVAVMKVLAADDATSNLQEKALVLDRNQRCMEVLDAQLAQEGVQRVAIFYGAAHLPDMHRRMLVRGFKLQHVSWLNAWVTR